MYGVWLANVNKGKHSSDLMANYFPRSSWRAITLCIGMMEQDFINKYIRYGDIARKCRTTRMSYTLYTLYTLYIYSILYTCQFV